MRLIITLVLIIFSHSLATADKFYVTQGSFREYEFPAKLSQVLSLGDFRFGMPLSEARQIIKEAYPKTKPLERYSWASVWYANFEVSSKAYIGHIELRVEAPREDLVLKFSSPWTGSRLYAIRRTFSYRGQYDIPLPGAPLFDDLMSQIRGKWGVSEDGPRQISFDASGNKLREDCRLPLVSEGNSTLEYLREWERLESRQPRFGDHRRCFASLSIGIERWNERVLGATFELIATDFIKKWNEHDEKILKQELDRILSEKNKPVAPPKL